MAGFNAEGFRASDGALLAGAIPERFSHVSIKPDIGQATPGFDGKFNEFLEKYPHMHAMLHNDIKKCPNCGKINSVAMPNCNGCGTDIAHTPVTQSPNMFNAFIYGIREGNFPFLISMRYEREDMMVFDDPLAITRAHVLSVPTDVYCPDIRYLFSNPKAGLELLVKIEACAWLGLWAASNGEEHAYLRNKKWVDTAISERGNGYLKEGSERSRGDLRDCVMAAFNLPPSQYQLHLQYMLPPMLPQQVGIYKAGAHFKKGRHFPLKYVVQGLLAFVDANKTIADPQSLTPEGLIESIGAVGVNYDHAYEADLKRFDASCEKLANFSEADFKYAIIGDKVTDLKTGEPVADKEAPKVSGEDKVAMQGYGRPYNEAGKPGGKYYKHFRNPDSVIPTFGASTVVPAWVVPEGEVL